MLKKRVLMITIPIALLFIFYFSIRDNHPPEVIGWGGFESDMKKEFANIEGIGWVNLTNPTISIYVSLYKRYEKDEIEAVFLRILEFLDNEESYNSLQDRHKDRFKYAAVNIKINFEISKIDNNIVCYYEASTETSGNDFNFDSFKYWGLFYQGEYIKTYELPEK